MKKSLLAILFIIISMLCFAQPRAIGVRVGYNFELSYQHSFKTGMLEADLGATPFLTHKIVSPKTGTTLYRYGRTQATVSYNWIYPLEHNFCWYIGLSAGVSYGYGEYYDLMGYNRIGVPVGAHIGVEHQFKVPLNLSLDWRPMINVFGLKQGNLYTNLLNVALGVRYRF